MRIVHQGPDKSTVYHVNDINGNYYISERPSTAQVGAYVFYFLVSVITFLTGTLVLMIIKKGQPLDYYIPVIEMFIYSTEFLLFGILNRLNENLMSHVLFNFLITSTVGCQILIQIVIKIFS